MSIGPTALHERFPHMEPAASDDLDVSRVPPYHAIMRRVHGAVLATTSWRRLISGL
jgi:hypothetical protein